MLSLWGPDIFCLWMLRLSALLFMLWCGVAVWREYRDLEK